MRRAALALCLWLAACPNEDPRCEADAQCDDLNPCTRDACTQGDCTHDPEDAAPPQAAPDDCVRQACQDGVAVDLADDTEQPPQAADDDCVRQICLAGAVEDQADDTEQPPAGAECVAFSCQDGLVVADEVAGVCPQGTYCDARAGCQDALRDLATEPGDATILGAAAFGQLTDFTGLAAGDFNGDGILDLALSTPDQNTNVNGSFREGAGEVLLSFGPFSGVRDLAQVAPITIHGAAEGDRAGLALAACDFSGDGVDDLLVSAPNAEPGGLFGAGQVFGLLGPIVEESDLFALAVGTQPGLVISGLEPTTFPADRLLCADVNGDGTRDLVFGNPNGTPNGQVNGGQVLVFFGGAGLTGTRDFAGADLAINGAPGMALGTALAAGDFDGDGRLDLAANAAGNPNDNQPEGVMVLPNASFFGEDGAPLAPSTRLEFSDPRAALLNTADAQLFGFALAAGDLNRDGIDDLALSELLADPLGRGDAGEVFVVFGGPGLTDLNLASAPEQIASIAGFDGGDETGISLAVGDLNGDGTADLLLGAHRADGFDNLRPESGEAIALFGGARFAPGAALDLTQGAANLALFGASAGDALGKHLQLLDLNGDGRLDLVLASPRQDTPAGTDAGGVSILFAPQ